MRQKTTTGQQQRSVGIGMAALAVAIAAWASPVAASRTVTVEGRLFYNDLRESGRFEWRRDPAGSVGQKVGFSPGAMNLLAAWFVVADFYELDTVDTSTSHPTCKAEESLGSSTINSRGEYSLTRSIADDVCGADGDTAPDIGVRFRLRYCNSGKRCFSVEDDNQNNYRLWHHNAQPSAPLQGTAGTHVLTDFTFQAAPYDDYAKAANLYAGIVEGTNVWHLQTDVSFFEGGEDELFVRFPSSTATVPSTTSGHQIHHPQVCEWIKGGWHEYGTCCTTGPGAGEAPAPAATAPEESTSATARRAGAPSARSTLTPLWLKAGATSRRGWSSTGPKAAERASTKTTTPRSAAPTPTSTRTRPTPSHTRRTASRTPATSPNFSAIGTTRACTTTMTPTWPAPATFVANLQSVWSNLETMWD